MWWISAKAAEGAVDFYYEKFAFLILGHVGREKPHFSAFIPCFPDIILKKVRVITTEVKNHAGEKFGALLDDMSNAMTDFIGSSKGRRFLERAKELVEKNLPLIMMGTSEIFTTQSQFSTNYNVYRTIEGVTAFLSMIWERMKDRPLMSSMLVLLAVAAFVLVIMGPTAVAAALSAAATFVLLGSNVIASFSRLLSQFQFCR